MARIFSSYIEEDQVSPSLPRDDWLSVSLPAADGQDQSPVEQVLSLPASRLLEETCQLLSMHLYYMPIKPCSQYGNEIKTTLEMGGFS
jgi:hypothetical protein